MIAKLLTPLTLKIGAGLIIALLSWITVREVQMHFLHIKLDAAVTVNEQLERERDAANANVKTASEQHDITKRSLIRARDALKVCTDARDKMDEDNRKALASAAAKQRDTDQTLKRIAADYQRAMRDPACLICGNRPVCPALVGKTPA